MNIGDVINTADRLYPNSFDIREKLAWCSDVSHTIRNEVNKRYDFVRTDADNVLDVIGKIGMDRVQSVMSRERIFRKSNVRSWNNGLPEDVYGEVRVVYLIDSKPFRFEEYNGDIKLKNNFIVCEKKHSFEVGDVLLIGIEGHENDFEVTVCEVGDSILTKGDKLPEYDGEAVIVKKLCDELECCAPYDYMYVDYLIGKMCFYQNDYESCNQHMTQYNNKIALYQRFIKAREAYSDDVKFREYWK